jgi:hypothetical protein
MKKTLRVSRLRKAADCAVANDGAQFPDVAGPLDPLLIQSPNLRRSLINVHFPRGEELTPATRANPALNQVTARRRLELQAYLTALPIEGRPLGYSPGYLYIRNILGRHQS